MRDEYCAECETWSVVVDPGDASPADGATVIVWAVCTECGAESLWRDEVVVADESRIVVRAAA